MGGITKRSCGELGNVVWAALPSVRAFYLWLVLDSGCFESVCYFLCGSITVLPFVDGVYIWSVYDVVVWWSGVWTV